MSAAHEINPIESPCVDICQITEAGYCLGCGRSVQEITDWLAFSEHQRYQLMNDVLPQRMQALFE